MPSQYHDAYVAAADRVMKGLSTHPAVNRATFASVMCYCQVCGQVKNLAGAYYGMNKVLVDYGSGKRFCASKRHVACGYLPLINKRLIDRSQHRSYAVVYGESMYVLSSCCAKLIERPWREIAELHSDSNPQRILQTSHSVRFHSLRLRVPAEDTVRELYFCAKHQRAWMRTASTGELRMTIVNEVLSDAPDPRPPAEARKPREANYFYDPTMYEDSDDDSRDDPHFLYCSESEVSDSEEEAVESYAKTATPTEPPDRYADPRGRRVSERVRARVMSERAS
eukprot:gene28587-35456_t